MESRIFVTTAANRRDPIVLRNIEYYALFSTKKGAEFVDPPTNHIV
jgi:hypothetical protein